MVSGLLTPTNHWFQYEGRKAYKNRELTVFAEHPTNAGTYWVI